MLTVVTFKYQGARNIYRARHVNALERMLDEHLTLPHKLVCITDDPEGVECETYPAWPAPKVRGVPRGRYNNYRCLRIFEVAEELGERLLVLDLDVLIRKNIDSLITDDDFKILRGYAAPYNSTIYLLKSGAYKEVWESFNPDLAEFIIRKKRWIGTDQGWMSYCIPNAPTWDRPDGIKHLKKADKNTRMLNFSGRVKPWDLACQIKYPWVYAEYQEYLNG